MSRRRRPQSAAPTSGSPSDPPELQALRDAAAGLLYPSESDTPFEAFVWPGDGPASARAAVESRASGRRVDEVSLDAFFAELEAGDDAERFRTLRAVLTSRLGDVHVYRAGDRRVDVYLLGRSASGTWIGLRTQSIET